MRNSQKAVKTKRSNRKALQEAIQLITGQKLSHKTCEQLSYHLNKIFWSSARSRHASAHYEESLPMAGGDSGIHTLLTFDDTLTNEARASDVMQALNALRRIARRVSK